jgi:glycosyltransferase involved in cell wall biosynthesis
VHHRAELGGAPASLALLIRRLDRERFEPHVYCPPGASAELFREAGAIVHTGTVAGFTHIWASTYRGARWLVLGRELARLPRHLAGFRRTLQQETFDLVHLNDSPLLPAAWLARRHGIPVVWHLRSAPPHGGRDLRSRLVRRAVLRLSAATIAINQDVADAWDIPAMVVANPVDLDRFSPGERVAARAAVGLPAAGNVVSYVGFLYPAKGVRELIEAAALVREQGIQATYLLVGGGVRGNSFFRTPLGRAARLLGLAHDHEAEARARTAALGLERSVRFVSFTADAPDVYRASDVIVSPSRGPEIGRPLLEAAAVGIAAVGTGSTTGGGILEPGVTTVFAAGSGAEPLAAAIADLLRDPAQRESVGIAARLHALSKLDPERNARLVEAVYERVGNRSPPRSATSV